MEAIRQLLLNLWNQIPVEWRAEVGGGLIVGGIGILAASAWAGVKLLAGRFRKAEALPPAAPPPPPLPPQPFEIKVVAQPPPQLEPAAFEPTTPAPFIPPPPTVGFVQRRDEEGRDLLELLRDALVPTSSQLVALWGHGKTTLAAEAARALKEAFKNRILWVSAEKRADFTFSTLLDEIAQKSGRHDLLRLAPEPKKAEVQTLLAAAPTLVVLDNFETVPTGEQKLCAEFLAQGCPFPALITTREKVAGAKNISLDKMSPAEATELLKRLIAEADLEQAVASLAPNTILEAADWNPLVMEWVVAQMMSDPPRVALEDLAHGEGDAARRVFDRSFNLPQLGDDGRDTLLALSLFTPSATREALAEVAGFGHDTKRLREAARSLTALRLIRMTPGNERLLVAGLTRQLSQVHLAKDQRAAEFRQRFVASFLRHAEAHAQTTPEDFVALEAEKDNVLNAMDAAFELGDWESVVRMRFAAEEFLDLRGYWDEAIRLSELALKAARSSQSEKWVADLSHNLAVIYLRRGELADARRLYDESLEIKKRLGDQRGTAITLHELGRLAQAQGKLDEARRLYDESLEINRRLRDQSGIAITLHQLGRLAEDAGNKAEAARLFRESLDIFEKLRSPDADIARGSLERVGGGSS